VALAELANATTNSVTAARSVVTQTVAQRYEELEVALESEYLDMARCAPIC